MDKLTIARDEAFVASAESGMKVAQEKIDTLSEKELVTELEKRGLTLADLEQAKSNMMTAIGYAKLNLRKESGSIYYKVK